MYVVRISGYWLGIETMWGGIVVIGWESGLYVGRGSADWLGMGTVCGERQCGLVGNRDGMWVGAVRIGWEYGQRGENS